MTIIFSCIIDGEVMSYTLKQPVGVAALILPWNGPSIVFLKKVCSALAAGMYLSNIISFNLYKFVSEFLKLILI